jgi:uncharacterized damage-inducible protein DinB
MRSLPRCLPFAAALLVAGSLAAPLLRAAEAPAAPTAPGLRGEVLLMLADAESKLTQLADATPAAKLSWRPAEGVRSMGEVLLHVASGNYEFASFWGAKPPAGVDLEKLEKGPSDKDAALATMKKSFEFLRGQIMAMSDADLDRPITIFGRKATVRTAVLLTATHAHEHLGQAIAYARMNGVVPPWSKQG